MKTFLHIGVVFSLVLLNISQVSCAQPQNLRFTHLTPQYGLYSMVWHILQDKQGYMWFGTWDGLYKYDGYKLISYQFSPFDSTSIAHNIIQSLWQDSEDNIWIGTIGGTISKFDRKTEVFTTYKLSQPTKQPILPVSFISAINKVQCGWAMREVICIDLTGKQVSSLEKFINLIIILKLTLLLQNIAGLPVSTKPGTVATL